MLHTLLLCIIRFVFFKTLGIRNMMKTKELYRANIWGSERVTECMKGVCEGRQPCVNERNTVCEWSASEKYETRVHKELISDSTPSKTPASNSTSQPHPWSNKPFCHKETRPHHHDTPILLSVRLVYLYFFSLSLFPTTNVKVSIVLARVLRAIWTWHLGELGVARHYNIKRLPEVNGCDNNGDIRRTKLFNVTVTLMVCVSGTKGVSEVVFFVGEDTDQGLKKMFDMKKALVPSTKIEEKVERIIIDFVLRVPGRCSLD